MIKKLFDLIIRHISGPCFYARFCGVKIGKNCFISRTNKYWGTEPFLIEIGDNVQITDNVSFHTHGGAHIVRQEIKDFDCFGKIKIGNGAYIGARSQIMPGVSIGEGCLIAAGSVVTKSTTPNSVYGGNPAKYICSTSDFIQRNKRLNIPTKGLKPKQRKDKILSSPSELFIIK